MELKYIFYITVNSINGKFYFGVHKTNPEVFDGYIGCGIYRLSQAILNIPFHKAVKKYGYNSFRRTTIKIFDTEKEAYEFEKIIITSILLKSKQCYNTTIDGIGAGNEILKKTVYLFTLNGEFLRSYKSARDAALLMAPNNSDTIRNSIKNCCLGSSYSSCGYFWSYYKEFIKKEDYQNTIKRRKNKIAQYTLSGKFLRYYDNITEARNTTGLYNLYSAIREGGSIGGFQWKYYSGDNSDIPPFLNPITIYRTKPIVSIDNSGKEEEYESIKKCIEIHPEFSSRGIKNVINGINKTHKGYKFRWKDEDIV